MTAVTTRLLITSDTHLPVRRPTRRVLPDPVWEAFDAADVVVHAGDWMDPELLDAFEERSARLVACWGNNDGDALRARLPETAVAEIDGLSLAVTHETGAVAGRERRCDGRVRAGRRHPRRRPRVRAQPHPVGLERPPAASGCSIPARPPSAGVSPRCTYMTAEVRDGTLAAVQRHALHPVAPVGRDGTPSVIGLGWVSLQRRRCGLPRTGQRCAMLLGAGARNGQKNVPLGEHGG